MAGELCLCIGEEAADVSALSGGSKRRRTFLRGINVEGKFSACGRWATTEAAARPGRGLAECGTAMETERAMIRNEGSNLMSRERIPSSRGIQTGG